ncbi:hypothetical protein KZZ19_009805 [Bacillus thuringiensis]|nr:hypothetical protein [Bacillus thuringiensis]
MKELWSVEVKESRQIVGIYCNKIMRNPKIKNPYKDRDLYIGI